MTKILHLATAESWQEYALLDSGNGQKLERFGEVTVVRPENQAVWKPRLSQADWDAAHAVFEYQDKGQNWRTLQPHPEEWLMSYDQIKFVARLTPFRHVGIFPEQAPQWEWTKQQIARSSQAPKILNLFAYTGLASVIAAAAGAHVTHVDSSKPSIDWAKENQQASGLASDSIRWIVDDALKFVRREARRGNTYDGIIMDPPAFGRGSQGQVWQFAESFPQLLEVCKDILSPVPLFFLITTYDIRGSALMLQNTLAEIMHPHSGVLEAGEQVLHEQSGDRLLSTSIFARWSKA